MLRKILEVSAMHFWFLLERQLLEARSLRQAITEGVSTLKQVAAEIASRVYPATPAKSPSPPPPEDRPVPQDEEADDLRNGWLILLSLILI